MTHAGAGTILAHWTGYYAVDISRPSFDTYHYLHATSCRTIWFSHEACSGVWIMIAFGCALASRVTAAWPRWSEPLSTMTNTRGASLYSGRRMTWPIRSMNGAMPVVAGVAANTFPVCTSSAASRARAPCRTYSCSTRAGLQRAAGAVGWQRPRGLDGRLGVHGQDTVAG